MNAVVDRITDLDQLFDGIKLCGRLVLWRLANIRVDYSHLVVSLEQNGWEAHIPGRPTPEMSLKRSIEEWVRRRAASGAGAKLARGLRGEGDTSGRVRIERVAGRGDEWVAFPLVLDKADFSTYNVQSATDLRVVMNKKTLQMFVTSERNGIDPAYARHDLTTELSAIWATYADLMFSEDLSLMVTAIVKSLGAVPVRDAGGTYFVPITEEAKLRSIKNLVENLPGAAGNTRFSLYPIPDTEEAKQTATQDIHDGLLNELHKLSAEFEAERAQGRKTRNATVLARIEEYRQVLLKAETYERILGLQKDEISREIDTLVGRAKELITK